MSQLWNTGPEPPPDRHAPLAMVNSHSTSGQGDGSGGRLAYESDPIELACCTLEWSGGRWHHDRACIMRAAPVP